MLQSLPPMLHMSGSDTMPSCSKAARGLSVLVRVNGIFTANAISPGPSLRQYPYRYAIRAGQNLPDKEFRYLRTLIVRAAVHWGFSLELALRPLTFQHWAGVSPYTSSFELARTCVFDKQSHGFFRCGPATLSTDKIMRGDCSSDIEFFVFETYRQATTANSVAGQTLSRSYGRCIAEFLNEGSPEHLGLLDLSTCVGLRYGRHILLICSFSCQFGPREFQSYDQFHSCFTLKGLRT